jgi:hypothetical protein
LIAIILHANKETRRNIKNKNIYKMLCFSNSGTLPKALKTKKIKVFNLIIIKLLHFIIENMGTAVEVMYN